jgi:hypothetical protein
MLQLSISELKFIPLQRSGLQKTALTNACTATIGHQGANHKETEPTPQKATRKNNKNNYRTG